LIVLALILSICSPIITSTTTSTPGPMEDDLRDKLATFSQWIPKQVLFLSFSFIVSFSFFVIQHNIFWRLRSEMFID